VEVGVGSGGARGPGTGREMAGKTGIIDTEVFSLFTAAASDAYNTLTMVEEDL